MSGSPSTQKTQMLASSKFWWKKKCCSTLLRQKYCICNISQLCYWCNRLCLIVCRSPGVARSTWLAGEAKVSKRAGALLHCCCLLLAALIFHLDRQTGIQRWKRKQENTPVSRLTSAMLASLVLSEWAAWVVRYQLTFSLSLCLFNFQCIGEFLFKTTSKRGICFFFGFCSFHLDDDVLEASKCHQHVLPVNILYFIER